ncbi:G-type lectin S-receptor-like serine/threonine-protein kinase At1g11410 isoform X1 [Euphorbia lathyris]|uniref:G-type lectin S-receptor-like serine/threonine-protein kinase At1g11410 isoform X1 n=2 Tax=Euphorbia lathyris TaxID=212925 RepID=UPI003314400F
MAVKKLLLQCLLLTLHIPSYFSLHIITANQALKDGDLLVSKNGKFAFGFFTPGSSGYRYLGIWFHKISEPSVVWVANRNHPINGSSGFLSVNSYGNLVLYNDLDQKIPLWSTNVSGKATDPCVAQLLDSGNLILLQGKGGRILWQSFDYQTDTRLPGMKLGKNMKTGLEWSLTSWKSADDPGIGEFSIKVDPTAMQIFLYKKSKPLWQGYLWPVRTFSDLYSYNTVLNQEEVYTSYSIADDSMITRQIVDHTGTFRWLRWSESDRQWKEFWSVPKTPCDLYAHCGAFGKCSSSNSDAFGCSCLPGYEPRSPRDWYLRDASGGCVRKREESSSFCRHGEGFLKVEDVKFPDSGFLKAEDAKFLYTSAFGLFHMNMSHLECEKECLRNCSCTAYASIDDDESRNGCLTWYGKLMDTRDHVARGFDMYVRVDAIEIAESTTRSNLFFRNGSKILILSVSSAWLTIIIFGHLWIRRNKRLMKKKAEKRIFDPTSGSIYYKNTLVANELRQSSHPQDISFVDLSTIIAATNNFSTTNELGQGGFGIVYKGKLVDGQEVAVKRLSKNSGQGIEEFKNEVMLIAKLQHKNLVKLLGCCVDGGEQMLIYEYLPNKALDSFLFDQTRRSFLDWRKRFAIITGIARGILYLHQDSRLTIIHRDLKCSNILLDANMNPKVSDFGMARIFRIDQIQEKTKRVVGTYGYMSPEYAIFGKFSVKSDVFSFGVILLEIVSAKKNNGFQESDPSLTLIAYVWELWRQNRGMEVVDLSLERSYAPHEVLRCLQIGLLCVQENAADRPTMSEVILMLSSEAAIPSPKQPAFLYRTSCINTSEEVEKRGSNSINDITITKVLAR